MGRGGLSTSLAKPYADGSRVVFIAFSPQHLTPIAIWGTLNGGSARPCCNTHRKKERKGLQLSDALGIALCLSRSALRKAGDFCTDFLILQEEKKKTKSLWALLHNPFTQTFSSDRFHVRNAAGLHLTYMEGPPELFPCSVIYLF